MDFNGLWSLMDVIVLAFGVYALYAAYVLKTQGKVVKTFLVFKETDVDSCRDLPAYAGAMSPKLYTMGGIMVAYGVIAVLNDYVLDITALYHVMEVVLILVLIWYGIEVKKSTKKYF